MKEISFHPEKEKHVEQVKTLKPKRKSPPVFYTKDNRPERKFKNAEKAAKELTVERAGYISTKKQIQNFQLAGQRLTEFRKEQFDFQEKEPDINYEDPTRRSDYDLADASVAMDFIRAKIAEKQEIQNVNETDQNGEGDTNNPDKVVHSTQTTADATDGETNVQSGASK